MHVHVCTLLLYMMQAAALAVVFAAADASDLIRRAPREMSKNRARAKLKKNVSVEVLKSSCHIFHLRMLIPISVVCEVCQCHCEILRAIC